MAKNDDLNLANTHWNDNVIIFLDFDGVINSAKFINDYLDQFKQPTEKTYYITEHIDAIAIQRVNKIVEALNAKVVISSAWRKAYCLDKLCKILESKGFSGEIIGETEILNKDRGIEIQTWMDRNNISADRVLILDDNDNMRHLSHRLILTSFDTGITDEHVQKAMELFGE